MGSRRWVWIVSALMLGCFCAGRSPAQTPVDPLVAAISAAVAKNLAIISGGAYAKFTAQRLYRKDRAVCVESRQQIAPPFVHYACVDPADLNVSNAHAVEAGKFYHALNIGRDELEFGASIGCRERPCVHEAIVYDSAQLPTIYRLATRFSVACYTRCEELVDELRRLGTAGGAPRSAMPVDATEKIVQIANAIAEETKPKWPSEPAPPFVRGAAVGPVALPFRTFGIFGASLCTAAQEGNTTITYRCARLADLDPSWLTNDECGPTDTRRRDGSCVSGRSPYNSIAPIFPGAGGSKIELPCRSAGCLKITNFDFGTGVILPGTPGAAETIATACNLNCARVTALLRYALQIAASATPGR